MCGITGIVDFAGGPVDRDLVDAMAHTLDHRGPDDRGVFVHGAIGLGHTRLSILDLSAAGHQPMTLEDRLTLVYNGELYNFRELSAELTARGRQLHTRCDTEVVLHALDEWGTEALARFSGMFALALWDHRAQRLLLARDRFGIKPLYLADTGSGIVFGSEIKALLASGKVNKRLDPAALHEYLYYGNALGRRTLFAGVRKLLPGHALLIDNAGRRELSYWSPAHLAPLQLSEAEAEEAVRSALDSAIERHLISDVPVGVFLSGGIDSSAITAYASRHVRELSTYSVEFDYQRGNSELGLARRVAQRFGTDHHELKVSAGEVPQVLEALVRAHDQPFGDAANIPLYLLCRALQNQVKVVLQGDGGDEIFAGYRRYNVLARERLWRHLAVTGNRYLPSATPSGAPLLARARRYLSAIGQPDAATRMALLLTVETLQPPPTAVLTPHARQWIEASDPFARYREVAAALPPLDALQTMLMVDASIILPDIFLEKVDRATMAHGIEVRVPLLDAELTELVMALPGHLKVRGLQKKYLLKKALRGTVPDEVLDGKKRGFGVPYSGWLRTSLAGYLRDEVLSSGLTAELLDRAAVTRLIDEHVSGQRDHGFLLYKLLNLVVWDRLCVRA